MAASYSGRAARAGVAISRAKGKKRIMLKTVVERVVRRKSGDPEDEAGQ
jgi:hypothetical protein